MKICADGFCFDFPDAIDAFIFDEIDNKSPNFHGVPMKAVDIIAEFNDSYIFVEMKNYGDSSDYDFTTATGEHETNERKDHFKWLKNYLKYKYRDSYLFRHAEEKVDKPIHYICLLTFDNAINTLMQKALRKELPVGKASKRWQKAIAASCQVVNVDRWNLNFPRWPIKQITT